MLYEFEVGDFLDSVKLKKRNEDYFMIKLIASDLDGTLLQNGAQSLPEHVIPFIEKLATEHGILFVAASGRQYPNLLRLFGSASKHMAFICENGSLVFHKDKLLAGHPMDKTFTFRNQIAGFFTGNLKLAARQG